MILLAITTDGRGELLEQTVASLEERVSGIDGPRLIFDDSGDAGYREWLRGAFQPLGFEVLYGEGRVGQGVAVAKAWEHLASEQFDEHPYVLWCEDDFLFERDVDLDAIRSVLDAHPYLQQMALLRQPWFPGEIKAGGIIQRDPGSYRRVSDGEHDWFDHRLWFTLNPNLFRRELCKVKRPTGRRHEWNFSRQLCEDPEARFGIWGSGETWVRHIGEQRVGCGY